MARKYKIFGREFEWYDIKTKFKKMLRQVGYSFLIQQALCFLISSYLWLVYLTSKKKFINAEFYIEAVKQNKALICTFWHNRLAMIPFLALHVRKKGNMKYKFMTLASNHGDGQFVGKVMKQFGYENIYGSSQGGRKASRGIDLQAVRQIIRGLKNGKGLGITPDGPRGPNQKVNSEIINIAKISSAIIMPVSYSTSNFIQINSWDKFKVPLPFSKINFYYGKEIIIDKNSQKDEEEELKINLENALNYAQQRSEEFSD